MNALLSVHKNQKVKTSKSEPKFDKSKNSNSKKKKVSSKPESQNPNSISSKSDQIPGKAEPKFDLGCTL